MEAAYQQQWIEQLVHKARWERCTGQDENSQPRYAPKVPIRCYVEDLSLSRQLSTQEHGLAVNMTVLVAGDQEINNDDRLSAATDRFGRVLFTQGVVMRVVNEDDPTVGRVWRTAYLQLQ